MDVSLLQIIIALAAGIIVIIVGTTRFGIPAFFALLIACFVTGLLTMGVSDVLAAVKSGFGGILASLGFIIVLGTALGLVLEKSGCTRVMAETILKIAGDKNAPLAIALTGFIVGLPVFCDSGYIVLSGINKSLIRRTGRHVVTMSVSLAAGLYAVHCLLPPHPGAAAAAVTLNVEFGKLILYGLLIAAPAMLIGYFWALRCDKHSTDVIDEETEVADDVPTPNVFIAFLPVLIPLLLISLRSIFIASHPSNPLLILGDPFVALAIALLVALLILNRWNKQTVNQLLQEGLEKAGGILLIIGAGGAFGAVLAATKIGDHFAALSFLGSLGLLFPFLVTSLLKTAQGSSTVAIITSASIVLPLLPQLGLDSENGRMLCVLAMGAGSMMISHANDAYFWVISKFSGIDMRTMLRTYTVGSIFMGITAFICTYILSKVI
jgi:gluconate:H+ symporter, GntP family